jgi:LacI family transcriptional regulator
MSRDLGIVDERLMGFRKALDDYGLTPTDEQVIYCSTVDEESRRTIRELLAGDRPDGIVASVEKLATHTYSICNEIGIDIPVDVKIIAFSSLQIASLLNPSLTTITQPAFEIGKSAATLLFKSLLKKGATVESERIVLPSSLIERASTG